MAKFNRNNDLMTGEHPTVTMTRAELNWVPQYPSLSSGAYTGDLWYERLGGNLWLVQRVIVGGINPPLLRYGQVAYRIIVKG